MLNEEDQDRAQTQVLTGVSNRWENETVGKSLG